MDNREKAQLTYVAIQAKKKEKELSDIKAKKEINAYSITNYYKVKRRMRIK